jgi:hypothetical protein
MTPPMCARWRCTGAGLGEAYAKAGDVEQACAEAAHVLDAVEGVNSARVDGRVLVLRRALHPYADVPAVREVEERSQAVMKTALTT